MSPKNEKNSLHFVWACDRDLLLPLGPPPPCETQNIWITHPPRPPVPPPRHCLNGPVLVPLPAGPLLGLYFCLLPPCPASLPPGCGQGTGARCVFCLWKTSGAHTWCPAPTLPRAGAQWLPSRASGMFCLSTGVGTTSLQFPGAVRALGGPSKCQANRQRAWQCLGRGCAVRWVETFEGA